MTVAHYYDFKKILLKGLFILWILQGPLQANPTPSQTVFSASELETLGADTIQESLTVLKQLTKNENPTNTEILYKGTSLAPKQQGQLDSVLMELSLDDIDKIEIDKNGNQIRYHLSKSLTKKGLTALFSFTLIEDEDTQKALSPPSTFQRPQHKLGHHVRVIQEAELNRLGVTTLEDALRLIGNLSISNASGIKSLRIRGFSNGNTKVLYNGIDLKDTMDIDGAPNFNFVPIEDVARIEVMSGSSSVMNGAGSSAGVINIVTKQTSQKGFFASKVAKHQYFTTLKYNVEAFGVEGYILGTHGYNNSQSALVNTSEKDLESNNSISVGFNAPLFSGNLNSFFTSITGKTEIDDEYANDIDDVDSFSDSTRHMASVGYEWKATKKLASNLRLGWNHFKRGSKNSPDGNNTGSTDSTYEGKHTKFELYNNFKVNNNQTLQFGGNLNIESGKQTTLNGNPPEKKQQTLGLYSQLTWVHKWVSSQIGSRVTWYNNEGSYTAKPTYHGSLYRTIPYIGIMAKGTLKSGFKLPSIYQKYDPIYGNENLKAEHSASYEISLSKTFSKLKLHSTYFNTKLEDKIGYDGKYININTSEYRGIEYGIQLSPIGIMDMFRVDVTTFDATDQNKPAAKVPDYKISLSTGFRYKRWASGLFITGEGDKFESNTKKISSYMYADISIHYDYGKNTSLFTKVHNIFNETYYTTFGYNQPGRTLYIGLKHAL